MKYAAPRLCLRTRVARERTLPTDHSHAALAGTPVQPVSMKTGSPPRTAVRSAADHGVILVEPQETGGKPDGKVHGTRRAQQELCVRDPR